jgi:hypothetical protein
MTLLYLPSTGIGNQIILRFQKHFFGKGDISRSSRNQCSGSVNFDVDPDPTLLPAVVNKNMLLITTFLLKVLIKANKYFW